MEQPSPIQDGYTPAELRDIARVMSWIGMAMVIFFLVIVITPAWPLQLLQPGWIDQRSGSLLSSGPFALLAAFFISAAPVVDWNSDPLRNRAVLVRRISTWIAIGYLLLIPLQTYAGVQLIREREQQQSQLLSKAKRAVAALEKATTETELRKAYDLIPGNKPRIGARLAQPMEVFRDRLADRIKPGIARLEREFEKQQANRWQRFLSLLLRNTLGQLSMFIGFAALGRRSPQHPTLLRTLVLKGIPNPLRRLRFFRKDSAI